MVVKVTRSSSARVSRGTTLVEVVGAIAVLGIALPPLLALFRGVAAQRVDHTLQRAASHLASGMLEEIVSKAYTDPETDSTALGPEEGARGEFDDVDDYDGLLEAPPVWIDGSPIPGADEFVRSVEVDYVAKSVVPEPIGPIQAPLPPGGPSQAVVQAQPFFEATALETDFKRIRVRVRWSAGKGGELVCTTLRTDIDQVQGGPAVGVPYEGEIGLSYYGPGSSKVLLLEMANWREEPVEILGVTLSAEPSGSVVNRMRIDGVTVWGSTLGEALPTGFLDFGGAAAGARTIQPYDLAVWDLRFAGAVSGSLEYDLSVFLAGGDVIQLPFTVTW